MLKSGLNRNSMPLTAPGSRHEATTTMRSSMKRAGIISFEARSMPSRTPWTITQWVARNTSTIHTMGLTGSVSKSAK